MCRMFAYLGREPIDLRHYLVENRASLAALSRSDGRGQSHRDGWGIGHYVARAPKVVLSTLAACDDPAFAEAVCAARPTSVIAHVRQKSVGPLDPRNNHPFARGTWMFAHNGTVTGFSEVEPRLTRDIDSNLLATRRGSTDSELVFLWLLSRLQFSGETLEEPSADPVRVATVLAESTTRIDHLAPADDEGRARLNFLLTDGVHLFATRLRRSLFWLARGQRDERPASASGRGVASGGVLVASEPLSDEPWQELADGSMLAVGPSFVPSITSL